MGGGGGGGGRELVLHGVYRFGYEGAVEYGMASALVVQGE